MFIGHFGVGFGAKKVSPRPSLGTLLLASQFVDLLWPIFLIFGIERVAIEPGNTVVTPLKFVYYPFSHSLLAAILWGLLFGFVYWLIRKDAKSAIVLGALVLSHWILDLISHRPDLPLIPGEGFKVGMDLWRSVIATVLVEGFIFIGGVFLYVKVTRSKNKTGIYSLWSLVSLLAVIYVFNLFGPPPESTTALAYVGLAQWLFIIWGYWIDRNRSVVK